MTWQSLGAVVPIEKQWIDYQPTTQAPESPTESLVYRLTGLNVETFDPDQFYALVRFKYGEDAYSRAFRLLPSSESRLVAVDAPLDITTFPFSWVPQVQLVYTVEKRMARPVNWAIRIDEFVGPDPQAIALANLSRFLY